MKKLLPTLFLGISVITTGNAAATPTLTEEHKIYASDGEAMDGFGATVSIDGDTALIGSENDDDQGDGSGSAYVYVRDSSGVWGLQQKLTPGDGTSDYNFGSVVAIEGDTAVVGRASWDWELSQIGSVYVFTRDSGGIWTEQQKITALDESPGDLFGQTLALNGNTLVIGATGDDDGGPGTGSAYIYTRDSAGTWSFQQKITAGTPSDYDNFASALTADGDTLAVAASGYDYSSTVTNSGIVYIFTRDSAGIWSQQQSLLPPANDVSGKIFGKSIALDGDDIIIGADFDDQLGSSAGAAYLFRRDLTGNWNQVQKLLAGDGTTGDYFGHSVDIEGDKLVIGAYGVDDNAEQGGAAYVFSRDASGVWNEQFKLLTSDTVDYDYFTIGTAAVSLSADTVLAGAELGDTAAGVSTGSAYTFDTSQTEGPDIAVSTSVVNFGDILLADSDQSTLTVSNIGTADLSISSIALLDGVDFSQTNDCPATLAPSTTCQITVTFQPGSVGALTDTLTILSNDASDPSYAVTLNGTGIDQLPDLVVAGINSPGTLPSGGYETISVTISNRGEADIEGGYYVHLHLDNVELGMTWLSYTPAAGESVDHSWFVSLPNMRGNHTLRVTVDTLDDIVESDESNNETSKVVFMQ